MEGYIDRSGQWVIPNRFELCGQFVGDIAIVVEGGVGFSVLDMQGVIICKLPFAKVTEVPYEPDLIKVYVSEGNDLAPSFVNRFGEQVLGPFRELDDMGNFGKDTPRYAAGRLRRTQLVGYYDRDGNLIIPHRYGSSLRFSGGIVAAADRNYTWGYINKNGEWLIEPQFKMANPFNTDSAAVKLRDHKQDTWMIIDRNGERISPCLFSDILDEFDGGFRLVVRKGQKFLIDSKCFEIWSEPQRQS